MTRTGVRLSLLIFLLLAVLMPGYPAAAQGQDDPPVTIVLSNGYRITFTGVDYHPAGTSTWSYRVEELIWARNLGYWILELPECAPPLLASPDSWSPVSPDHTTGLTGIKWDVPGDFRSGVFTVTVDGHGATATNRVAAKGGPYLAYGQIAGPSCGQNRPPSAGNTNITVPQGSSITVDVLSLASDPDGDILGLIDFQNPSAQGGSVVRVDNGTPTNATDDRLRYTPPAGFTGSDSFTYTVQDDGMMATGTVFATVELATSAPTANADRYTVVGSSLDVPAPGVLSNDSIPQGLTAWVVLASGPGQGTLDLRSDGSFTYTPPASFTGVVTFTYIVQSGVSSSAPAQVTLEAPDQQAPTVAWVSPIGEGGRYNVGGSESVMLQVEVSDNISIAQVRFRRWDAVNEQYVTIAEMSAAPYRATIAGNQLNPGWNQVNASALDGAGNRSSEQTIWLYRVASSFAPRPLYLPNIRR